MTLFLWNGEMIMIRNFRWPSACSTWTFRPDFIVYRLRMRNRSKEYLRQPSSSTTNQLCSRTPARVSVETIPRSRRRRRNFDKNQRVAKFDDVEHDWMASHQHELLIVRCFNLDEMQKQNGRVYKAASGLCSMSPCECLFIRRIFGPWVGVIRTWSLPNKASSA